MVENDHENQQRYTPVQDWLTSTEHGRQFSGDYQTWRGRNKRKLTNDPYMDFCTFMEKTFYKDHTYLTQEERKLLEGHWTNCAQRTEDEWLINILRHAF